jgi:hypothetical protein
MHQLLSALSELRVRDPRTRRAALKTDVEGLLNRFFPDSKSSTVVVAILDHLFRGGGVNESGPDDRERMFLSHIKDVKAFVIEGEKMSQSRDILETPEREDCLVSNVEKWDPLKLINYLLLQAIPFSNKRAIVATARDEGVSIIEWIAYHRVIGFDAFFIYTNDNTDGSLELLEILAKNNVITLIKNTVSPKVSPQQKCYEHSLYFLPQLRSFQWVSYLDIDEFFLPLKCSPCTIDCLFDQPEVLNESFSAAIFNWKWFGSSYKFESDDGLVLERFQEARSDAHGKSLSRMRDIVSMRPVHYPTLLPGCHLLDSEFNEVKDTATMQPVYGSGQINHYWNKSFEEFALKKVRGLSSQGLGGRQREFEQFFAWDARAGGGTMERVPTELLQRVWIEYEAIRMIPGVHDQLTVIKRNVRNRLSELELEFGLRATFEEMKRAFSRS